MQNTTNNQSQNQETTSDKVLRGGLKLAEVLAKIFIEFLKIILKILQAFGAFAGKHPIGVATVIGFTIFTYLLLTNYAFQSLAINVGGLALVIAFVVSLFKGDKGKSVSSGKKGKSK